MNLFFDTETSNLPEWRLPSDDPGQPHLLQLAAILAHEDGTEVETFSTLVKPYPGCIIGEEAFKAHGITIRKATEEGMDGGEVADRFFDMVFRAERVIGHNVTFDIRMMRIHAAKARGFKWDCPAPYVCTMRTAAPIIKLPPTQKMLAAGFTKFKAPNLGECVQFFFGETLDGAHDALVDVRACKRVYHAIQDMKVAA